MNNFCIYEICVKNALPEYWSEWLDGLSVHNESKAQTTLRGPLLDQAALIGLLTRIHALNLTLISVKVIGPDVETRQGAEPQLPDAQV